MNERRRNMDSDYVTRREWLMHLRETDNVKRTIEKRLDAHAEQLDRTETYLARMLGGIAVLVVVGNVVVALVVR